MLQISAKLGNVFNGAKTTDVDHFLYALSLLSINTLIHVYICNMQIIFCYNRFVLHKWAK